MNTALQKEIRKWAALCVLFLVIAFLLGARHDYLAYQWIWADIVNGRDPWINDGVWTKNAYGLTYNLFAWVYAVHPMLPKLVFVSLWLGVGIFVLSHLKDQKINRRWVAAFYFFNPIFWIEFVSWGHHEAVVAALAFSAYWALQKKREVLSGVLLAVAIHFKYYPIVLLPLFWIRPRVSPRHWRHRFLVTATLGTILGWVVSWALWGASTLYPLTFARTRRPEGLSILQFLSSPLSPWQAEFSWQRVTLISKVALALSSAVALFAYWKGRFSFLLGVGIQLLLVVLCYQVGYLQYQQSLLFLFPLIAVELKTSYPRLWPQSRAIMAVYVVFLATYSLFIVARGQYHPAVEWVNYWISIPYFILGLFLLRVFLGGRFFRLRTGR